MSASRIVLWLGALLLLLAAALLLIRQRLQRPLYYPQPGDLCSVLDGSVINVAKILVVEEHAIHIRLYKESFATRPAVVDPSSLSLGAYDDPDGFGIGHIPLSREAFLAMSPQFIQSTGPLAEEELEGYELWKEEAGGALFK